MAKYSEDKLDRIRCAAKRTQEAYLGDPRAAMPFDIIRCDDILAVIEYFDALAKINGCLAQHLVNRTIESEDQP